MSQSFTQKVLEIRLTLAAGSFGGRGNTKIIRGLATDVAVEKPGLPDKPKATVKIVNLPVTDMESLTTLAFRPLQAQKNLISIMAGDDENGLAQVFAGEITNAWGNFNTAPDPTFEIEAMSGYYPALTPKSPTASPGAVPLSAVVEQLAGNMGYSFRNEGVTAQLRNSVLNGSPMEQAQAAARQAGAELILDDATLILLPAGQARKGNAVLLTKDSGMIGYPTFNTNGISLKCFFNPVIIYGGLVQIESRVPKASGIWKVTKLSHRLSAFNASGGPWETELEAAYQQGA